MIILLLHNVCLQSKAQFQDLMFQFTFLSSLCSLMMNIGGLVAPLLRFCVLTPW